MYHLQIAVSLVHCFSFTSLPSVSGYSVNIQQDRSIHALQCRITISECHASSTQQCTWKYFPCQPYGQTLCTRQYAKCHQKLESMRIIRSFDHMVKITPAAAGPNPFAVHFPFRVPALNHFKMSKQVFHAFMINDQLDPKIWPSKAQRSVKDFSSKHVPVTQIQVKSLGNNFQSHCSCNCIHLHAIAFWTSFDNSSKVLRNPLPTWSLPDACTSVLAGCFHFTLSHSCCPFFFAKVCLVANCPWYILSAFSQCNFKAMPWQISSNGACMVILLSECFTSKLLFHWFIAFLSQASLP